VNKLITLLSTQPLTPSFFLPLPQDPERYFPEFSYDSFKVVFFPFGLSLIWNRGRKKEGVKG